MTRQFVLNVTISERQDVEVRKLAAARGVTVSAVVRDLLDIGLDATPPTQHGQPADPNSRSAVAGYRKALAKAVADTRREWDVFAKAIKKGHVVDEAAFTTARLAYEKALTQYREANSA